MSNSPRRFIYLLTIWQERSASPGEPAVWRYSLENARTGERRGFVDLGEVNVFLQQQTKNSTPNIQQTEGEKDENEAY